MDSNIDTPSAETTTAPTPTPTPESNNWRSALSPELQSNTSLGKFDSVEALAKSYINAERLIGRDKIPMPQTDEDFMAVYDRLGRPKSPEDYGFKLDGVEDSQLKGLLEQDLAWFGPKAHKLGLNTKQANALLEAYISRIGEVRRASDDNVAFEFNQAQQALRQEFGKEGAEDRVRVANLTLSKYMSKDLVAKIQDSGLGRSAEFIKFIASVGDDRLEDMGIDSTGNSVLTPASIKDEISRAMADPAYLDKTHPGHSTAVEKVSQLFNKAAEIR